MTAIDLNIQRNMLGDWKKILVRFDAIGTDGDQVHVFVGAVPRYAPSNVMQIICIYQYINLPYLRYKTLD
ncbi:Uncharacterised protein [uncultured archaeon]|nr:Uncharacterised protein [uncultured archaeon]